MSVSLEGERLASKLKGPATEIESRADGLRIVMANELLSYREVIAAAIRRQRPKVEVVTVEPEMLDTETARLDPEVVVCSQVTDLVRRSALVWVELYPEHGSLSFVSVAGELSTIEDIQFEDLVHVIDRALDLARSTYR